MMTHAFARLAICFFVVTAALEAGDDSWQKKPADQWSQDDVRLLLNDSPWAKRVKVRYIEVASPRTGGGTQPTPGPFPSPSPGGTPPIGIPGGRGPGSQGPTGVKTASEVLVRWQSASVVRQAFKKAGIQQAAGSDLAEENYLIAVVGMPDLGTGFEDADDSQVKTRLRDGARLFVGNKRSLIPARVRAEMLDDGWTILYIFPRSEVGPLGDEKVKLLARVGPAQFSAEFKTKDMDFGGKPDL
ncbi:MAG: hypothetical protein EHM23_29155 [Acidobacteria bacterium]|nr:MAG: hypothetical protein EHM23_29155 [Acidobacteriota bacterium]